MNSSLKISQSIIFAVILLTLVLSNCKKKPNDPVNTDPAAPTANTDTASFVSQTWATLNGLIKAGNLLTTVSFELGTDSILTTFCTISANPDTLSGNMFTRRTANLTSLMPNTTYYYRVKAENSLDEAYGVIQEFTTLDVEENKIVFHTGLTYGEISDIEGNVYKTIEIGEQTWMAQNLAVTKYNDGEQITLAVSESTWQNDSTGAYSWYNNVETKYGALYNWYAVSTDKLCPDGWRVPTDKDWTDLTDFLGGSGEAGGKLKEATYMHWTSPNAGASNSSGFTALPGGYRYDYSGAYNAVQRYGYWWTSSSSGVGRSLYYSHAEINKININKRTGAYVRCIKE